MVEAKPGPPSTLAPSPPLHRGPHQQALPGTSPTQELWAQEMMRTQLWAKGNKSLFLGGKESPWELLKKTQISVSPEPTEPELQGLDRAGEFAL